MKKKLDIRKRFLQLAYSQLNPDFKKDTMGALEQALVTWYCFQYNVPPNDDKLMDMTLEELLVLQQMHNLKENPQLVDEINADAESYEDWVKKEMGDEYVSPEEYEAQLAALEEEEKKAAEKLPERITTDFSNVGSE